MTVPLGQSLQPSLTSWMGGALLERRIYRGSPLGWVRS